MPKNRPGSRLDYQVIAWKLFFFAVDIIGVVLLLYWSIKNDRRGPDAPSIGLFAYRETIKGPSPPAARERHSSQSDRRP